MLVGLIFFQYSRLDTKIEALDTKLDTKIDTKFDALDTKLDTKFDALDTKIDTKFDALDTKIDALDFKFDKKFDALGRDVTDVRERLARVEGHLMGPESLAPGPSPAPADGLDDDRRQAG